MAVLTGPREQGLVVRNRVPGADARRPRRLSDPHRVDEIHAPLVPVVATGDPDRPCRSDPDPEAPPAVHRRSCVMRREAGALADLGYEPRASYLRDPWKEELDPRGRLI